MDASAGNGSFAEKVERTFLRVRYGGRELSNVDVPPPEHLRSDVLRRAAGRRRLVGTLLFASFVVYLFHRLGIARRIGRALAAAGNPEAARVRPLAWGLTAALIATLAAKAFCLTLSLFYFFAFAAIALATPVVFGRQVSVERVAERR